MVKINIESGPIQTALTGLDTAANALDSTFSKPLEGDNELTMADKIDEINKTYEKIQKAYHELLLSNIASTKKAVEIMQEKDENIAEAIQIPR